MPKYVQYVAQLGSNLEQLVRSVMSEAVFGEYYCTYCTKKEEKQNPVYIILEPF